MKTQVIKQYVLLFLGCPVTANTFLDKSTAIDEINFEIDVANEVYMHLIQEENIVPTQALYGKSVYLMQQIQNAIEQLSNSGVIDKIQQEWT